MENTKRDSHHHTTTALKDRHPNRTGKNPFPVKGGFKGWGRQVEDNDLENFESLDKNDPNYVDADEDERVDEVQAPNKEEQRK